MSVKNRTPQTDVISTSHPSYRARARASRPAAPAKLTATAPVGAAFGVEVGVEVEVGAAPEEPEDVVWLLPEAVSEEDEAEEVVTAGVDAEPAGVAVATSPPSSAMAALVAQALTLSGRLLYQSGICPCSICWNMLAAWVGLARAETTEGGIAVMRTPRTEVGMEPIRAFRSPA